MILLVCRGGQMSCAIIEHIARMDITAIDIKYGIAKAVGHGDTAVVGLQASGIAWRRGMGIEGRKIFRELTLTIDKQTGRGGRSRRDMGVELGTVTMDEEI